ncbi:type I-E CRISPR-associated protein Cas5/CasD [Streptomyces reticuliscabiei]|uniref:type I-E CRISPR-associated protein Cas5/CasD n=1 Tax=Streptomyces reticuliscabiei TaxID=146821 RepID=UPI000A3BB494|nr:type I-E CRISPR-associated protein Cas5/CasD [Streptomyces reticuliscabiei]
MHTVLLRLSAPMQSWGTTSQWEERATTVRPTKSGVTGIVANALGYELDDDLSALVPLQFAVRADRPGRTAVDHQTAGGGHPAPATLIPSAYGAPRGLEPDPAGTLQANETATGRTTVLIIKQYVTDAAFLAGLSTPDKELAEEIAAALTRPARPLYLGRRSCPPAHPIYHSTTHLPPETWPERIPLLAEASDPNPQVWTETSPGPGTIASPEQVPTTFQERDHRLLHLALRRVRPATPQPPGGAA